MNYFRKILHHRCLTGSLLRHSAGLDIFIDSVSKQNVFEILLLKVPWLNIRLYETIIKMNNWHNFDIFLFLYPSFNNKIKNLYLQELITSFWDFITDFSPIQISKPNFDIISKTVVWNVALISSLSHTVCNYILKLSLHCDINPL